jgi:hypothetical protein
MQHKATDFCSLFTITLILISGFQCPWEPFKNAYPWAWPLLGVIFANIKERLCFFQGLCLCFRNLCSFVLGQAPGLSKDKTFLVLFANAHVVLFSWSHPSD